MNWDICVEQLAAELTTEQLNTWIKPLQVEETVQSILLFAPNRFVKDWVTDRYLDRIQSFYSQHVGGTFQVTVRVGSSGLIAGATDRVVEVPKQSAEVNHQPVSQPKVREPAVVEGSIKHSNRLNADFRFENFVEGKSNQLARAAAQRVSEKPGSEYHPLFLYGDTGLGQTHLMHAVGNQIRSHNPNAKIIYVHSERFVADMVKALQLNAIADFKRVYRNVDALLIDDIQFFAGKEKSQEEFFHTFNALLDRNNQMILTCDKYQKEIDGLEERLKSRLGWGLPVIIEPPELETRAAVLLQKASSMGVSLPNDCAIYIAQRIRSNIRELEGALKRVVANAKFTNQEIDLALVKDALKDLFVISAKMVSIENIQKTVAEYYNIKLSDLLSKRRSRSITRPRQLAMALTKELTRHSLPEIGEAFNGRDHTTVLHACKKIAELRKESPSHEEDYRNLTRALTN